MFGSYEQFFSYKNSLNVFTWTILSTLDSRAANNFSLIFFFYFNLQRETRDKNLFHEENIYFYFDLSTKSKLFGQPALEFFNFIGEKKKLRQKPERLLYEWLTSWWVCTQSNEKKKSAHCYLCREKILFYILFTKWAVINKIKENKKKTKKTSKYKLETKVIILLIFKAN